MSGIGLAFTASSRKVTGTPGTPEANVTYIYTATESSDSDGATESDSETFSIAIQPRKPANLRDSEANGQVTFSRPAIAGVDGWEHSQDSGSTWTAVCGSGASTNAHIVTDPADRTAYNFKVRACVGSGNIPVVGVEPDAESSTAAVALIEYDNVIERSNLAQSNAIRGGIEVDGNRTTGMGCNEDETAPEDQVCSGYGLAADLDFGTDGDGAVDADDEYSNEGDGWETVGDEAADFNRRFQGNGHTITNLTIGRSEDGGFFGVLESKAKVTNVGFVSADIDHEDVTGDTGSFRVGGARTTRSELQAPTPRAGSYANWATAEWAFRHSAHYPLRKADAAGDGTAAWWEFGPQALGPPLKPNTRPAGAGTGTVSLAWTASAGSSASTNGHTVSSLIAAGSYTFKLGAVLTRGATDLAGPASDGVSATPNRRGIRRGRRSGLASADRRST